MSIVPVIAGLAFLCGGYMLFEDLCNEVYYVESAALVRKFAGKTDLSKEAQTAYKRAKDIVDKRTEIINRRNLRTEQETVAMRTFLSALTTGNMDAALKVLQMKPFLKNNPLLFDIIEAVIKKDNAAVKAAFDAFNARREAPRPS